jgi:hypothetical protein
MQKADGNSMADQPGTRLGAGLPTRFEEFRDFHAGASMLVCGLGRSLSLLGEPERFITIGVNDVGRMFDPDYLVVLNPPNQFAGDRFDYVRNSRARAVFSHLRLPIEQAPLIAFRLGQRGGTEPTGNGLPHTRNSPYLAAVLARYMGARRIGLLGVDFTYHHFWGETGRHPLDAEVRQINHEYKRLAESFAADGVTLVNLSPTSRIADLPYMSLGEFAASAKSVRSLNVVSYATTPLVGVPRILSDCINARSTARAVAVQGMEHYPSGLSFGADVHFASDAAVRQHLAAADLVIVHNGRTAAAHRPLLAGRPVVTMAHNLAWNVDRQYVEAGQPGVVVAQYPAGDAAFAAWRVVPNPVPLWDPRFQPGLKPERITIVFTPADRHGVFAADDPRFMHSKGHDATLRILRSLAQRCDIDLVVRDARPLPHTEVLAAKRRAHIVIDECVTGGYHRNSLEGLAAGCVVVNAVGPGSAVAAALRRVTADDAPLPFATATLSTLEEVMLALINRGAAALAEAGADNRRWMERYWRFEDQWRRFWLPAFDAALGGAVPAARARSAAWLDAAAAAPRPVRPAAPAVAPRRAQGSVTIIIPFGEPQQGASRLPQLATTLDWANRSQPRQKLLVVEAAPEPRAAALCEACSVTHMFLPMAPGPFLKTRALNHGALAAETSHILFLDADLLLPPEFIAEALLEAEGRDLDGLTPWRWLSFLSEADSLAVMRGECLPQACRPVARFTSVGTNRAGAILVNRRFITRFGGMVEGFRGWGCEDNAFAAKLERLGRAGATQSSARETWHLFHALSALDRAAAATANPYHKENVALLARVRSLRTAEAFGAAFPPRASAA